MPYDVLILIATTVLAVVAVVAAVISVRNLKELRKTLVESPESPVAPVAAEPPVSLPAETLAEPFTPEPITENNQTVTSRLVRAADNSSTTSQELVPHHGQVARVVEGKVVVTPTRSQVAHAIMGQRRVRFAIWMTGLTHALRPESRDRILGMMRRDYRDRRRHRESAARAAMRSAHSPATSAAEWSGRE